MVTRGSDRAGSLATAGDSTNEHEDGNDRGSFPIVGVGASAGGLEAFTELLESLPLDTGMAFVLVQHLDPQHESALPQLLSRVTSLPVHEITHGLQVEANHVYVIPPNTDLSIVRGVLRLRPRSAARVPHRSIDSFFESLAQDQRERAIGVVLSGTATDGTVGLEAIKAEGGITFAQDDSARYDSMPRSAVAAACVDFVLSPRDIAKELARIAAHPYIGGNGRQEPVSSSEEDAAGRRETGKGFQKILLLLRNHSEVDFSLYKPSTIHRRIARRMVLNRKNSLESYIQFLRSNTQELDALYSDALISVTSFFRNPETFDVLERKVLPKLLKQRGDDPLRVWVLGCSTGQEAYSIAMAFVEAAEKAPRMRKLQVFATDLNDALLDKARHGLYPKSIAQDVTPERLRRFFVEEEGGYRIVKPLREMVVFARQNLIDDPPFSRMDLISCRNVLIYLEQSVQRKVLPVFHYALKPGGFLVLGASESVAGFTELFEPLDRKHKVYARRAALTPSSRLPAASAPHERSARRPPRAAGTSPRMKLGHAATGALHADLNAQREADRLAIDRFAPPGVLVNAALQILQFRGATGAYLEPPTGKASFDVLKMARKGLMLPLRTAINKAIKDGKPARKENVRIEHDLDSRTVNLEVIPLRNVRERCFLIVFEDVESAAHASPASSRARASRAPRGGEPRRVAELETELAETRDYLQSLREQQEAAQEELQASNEEVQSANEELQSINEELETSKEELESANEELITVNDEMTNRNTELSRVNNDLVNVQTSTRLAIVVLGRDLTVRRFSAQAEKQLNLLAGDVGQPFRNVRHNLDLPDLEPFIRDVIDSVHERERVLQDRDGRWFSLRVRPYLTLDKKVDGAVLVLVDIDQLKRNELAAAAARAVAENTIDTVREALLVLDDELRVESANHSFYRIFGVTPAETVGKYIYELGNRQWNIPRLRALLEEVLPQSSVVEDFQIEHDFEQLGERTMLLSARRIHDPERRTERILLTIEDISARNRHEAELRESAQRFELLFERSPLPKWVFDLETLGFVDVNEAAVELYGYSRDEFLRMSVLDVGTPEADRALHAALAHPPHHLSKAEARHLKKNGEIIDVELRSNEITVAGRRLCLVSVNDTTDRKRAEKVQKELTERLAAELGATQRLQEASTLLITGGGVDALYQQILDAAIGLMRAEMGSLQLVDEDQDALQLRAWRGFGPGFPETFGLVHRDTNSCCNVARGTGLRVVVPDVEECEFLVGTPSLEDLRKSGIRAVQSTPLVSRDGRLLGMISTYWREPYQPAEHELRLLDVLARQAADLVERTQAEDALKEADRHKNEFLAMLAHELRNPLAPIRNALQAIRLTDGNPEQVRSVSAMMERQVGQMVRLVDDLLDMSRISRGKIELRKARVELASSMYHAVEAARSQCEAKGQELKVDLPSPPIYLVADPTRLAQVVGNLLNNACKFTRPGGHIGLIAEAAEGGGSLPEAVIRVSDDGVGIAPDQLPHIFDMFMQVDSTLERSVGGLGMGLTLVKELVEMHGGTVEAHSAGIGQGSEFTVRLPIASETADAPEQPIAGTQLPKTSRRILIVDDNRDSAESLGVLLELTGNQTHAAYDGLEAVEAAATFRPEVVLLDIGLPKLNGYDVARRIRELPGGKKILLVAMTGWGQDEDRRRSEDAGFDAHMVKPVDPAALTKMLADLGATAKP
jgi:two-component system CheB/CheR fusion protein